MNRHITDETLVHSLTRSCIIHVAYSLLIPQNECLLDIICMATVYVILYTEDNAKAFIYNLMMNRRLIHYAATVQLLL
jgi:hypothetical protein